MNEPPKDAVPQERPKPPAQPEPEEQTSPFEAHPVDEVLGNLVDDSNRD